MSGPPSRHSTIGQERLVSPVAHVHDEAEFVRQQLASYGVYPDYYRYMNEINTRGPRILGQLPELPALAPQKVQAYMTHGVPLIDGRARAEFAKEHVPGSFNIELDASFGIYVGWLLPFNKPLMLQIEDANGRKEAVAQLTRIGYEQLRGYLNGGVTSWKAAGYLTKAFEAIDVDELARRWQQRKRMNVLDVRDATEWGNGHIPGAQHIHIGDLMRRLHELPPDVPIATMCRTGHRAEMAASIIAAHGNETIAVQKGGVGDWISRGMSAVYGADAASREVTNLQEPEHAHP